MAATLELKFYNTFWLKRIKSIQPIRSTVSSGETSDVVPQFATTFGLRLPNANIQYGVAGSGNGDAVLVDGVIIGNINGPVTVAGVESTQIFNITPQISTELNVGTVLTFQAEASAVSTSTTLTINPNKKVGTGQTVTNLTNPFSSVVKTINYTFNVNGTTQVFIDSSQNVALDDILNFTNINDFTYIPSGYAGSTVNDWYIEESRIRGGFNNTTVDLGVRAFIVEDNPQQQHRLSSMIYSGIYNSRTGINNSNQFSIGEDIVKTVDPINASIQKLYAEDNNLIIFQEEKVSRALIDKDAIYSAEGVPLSTASNVVIGQIIPYAGLYGISKDPKSFAVYGYRKYFTDRKRNCVLRLSRDGITEISSYGMHDFFRDELSDISNVTNLSQPVNKIVGAWDMHTKNYILSIQKTDGNYRTIAFDETVLGWTSFLSFKPGDMLSSGANFFSIQPLGSSIWQHHKLNPNNANKYSNFYNTTYDSKVTLVLNSNPSIVKNFKTIEYEGGTEWEMTSFKASRVYSAITPTTLNTDIAAVALPVFKYFQPISLESLESNIFVNNFKRKENKYFANLINNTDAQNGEILFGQNVSGVKGFFAETTLTLNNNKSGAGGYGKKELFAVSSNISQSSY